MPTLRQKLLRKIVQAALPFVRLYWKIFKPKTHGVKVIIEHDNKVLCIKNAFHYELWSFPGGGIKRNETPEEAAKREVLEEVGIKLDKLTYLGQTFSNSEGKRDTIHAFRATSPTSDFQIDNFEVAKAKWFGQDDLLEFGPIALSIWKTKD